jgi:hypothetical protein
MRPEALASLLGGSNITEIGALCLGELRGFTEGLPDGLPDELSRLTTGLLAELNGTLSPLLDIGLRYPTFDRAGASQSTSERKRIELTSTVRVHRLGDAAMSEQCLHCGIDAPPLRTTTGQTAGTGVPQAKLRQSHRNRVHVMPLAQRVESRKAMQAPVR